MSDFEHFEDKVGELIQQMEEIFKAHDIRMSVYACGCCHSPTISFEYQGKLLMDGIEEANFDMF